MGPEVRFICHSVVGAALFLKPQTPPKSYGGCPDPSSSGVGKVEALTVEIRLKDRLTIWP